MRVSNKQLFDTGLMSMQQQSADALKYQRQIASGNRFAKASEGAVELARGIQLQFEASRYDMFKRNQDAVSSRAELTYTQLDTMASVMLSLQEVASRATYPGLDKTSLSALIAEAEVMYETVADLSTSVGGTNGYLVSGATTPRMGQPLVSVAATGSPTATISSDAVFMRHGTYKVTYDSTAGTVRLQIKDTGASTFVGPDGTSSTYHSGRLEGGAFRFSDIPDQFQDLAITPSLAATGTYQFDARDVQAEVLPESRFYDAGAYELRINSVMAGTKTISASLYFNGVLKDTISGVASNTMTSTDNSVVFDFGEVATDPVLSPSARTVSIRLLGDLSTLQPGDSTSFSMAEDPAKLPVEPGISLSYGVGYSNTMRVGPANTQDLLDDISTFLEGLRDISKSVAGPYFASSASAITGYSNLVAATNNVLVARTQAGIISAQVDVARSSTETSKIALDASKARLLETDIAEASTKLVRAQTLLQAAQSIFSRLESSNLFQRLG